MPLKEYTVIVERLQQTLGRGFADEPWLLNLPGKSVVCKIDPHYYLAVMPAFLETLGRLGGVFPDQVREALVKTGNLLTKAPERDPNLPLTVSWGGKSFTIQGAFVDADFIDRAVKTYGGSASILQVSDLKISRDDKSRIETFFIEKTPPQDLAYY
ncbi:hypothetical protein GO013_00370 [Pseudodesulfovibrio sp. JC047]|uniref:hypothetical protein n=1 Tax=Pseudodesulfovibrio sp. JC047 TaxID=2683199 RepID=UPI0013D5AE9E|nr:hypothetical protein [Pseudodesulfovibrio sp. JC047]NDV17871.1 hypothetical protein [Pseudodesulfovibrio sp. JC047]